MTELETGFCQKLIGVLDEQGHAHYALPLTDDPISLNPLIGRQVELEFTGVINCIACGRDIKKTYSQGYCFVCMTSLAQCDMCILKPEQCHYHLGTCREPDWGEQHCLQDHYVYLSNASGVKVGITRAKNIPGRWIDQGATQAMPIFKVKSRRISGLIEVAIKAHVSDKTNWRKMLSGPAEPVDLATYRDQFVQDAAEQIESIRASFGHDAIQQLDEPMIEIEFPVLEYPVKIASHNFDKNPVVSGKLMGIKGQYLIFDNGVINMRKFSGYQVKLSAE